MSDPVTTAGGKCPKLRAFLAALSVCPSISRAAEAAGIDRREHYRRYKADPVYAKAFEEAYAIGVQYLEDSCMEHALEGFEQPVIFQGELCYQREIDPETGETLYRTDTPLTIRKHSVDLKKFMLQGALPSKYRQNHHIEAHVSHSGIASLTDAELERIASGRDAGGSGGGAPAPADQQEQDPNVLPG